MRLGTEPFGGFVLKKKFKFDLDVMVIRSLIKCAEIVYFPLSIDSSNFAQ